MKFETIALALLAAGAASGAAVAAFPSAFAGAFGEQRTDFVDPMPVDLDANTIRSRVSKMSAQTAFLAMEEEYGGEAPLTPITSTTRQDDDGAIVMSVSLAGDHVIDFRAEIEVISEKRSTVDMVAQFNYDWLSDTGEVLPGDLARMESAAELLATEYVLSRLQERPMVASDDDVIQIYGRDVYDAIDTRVGRDAHRRIEAAILSKYVNQSHEFGRSARSRGTGSVWSESGHSSSGWSD